MFALTIRTALTNLRSRPLQTTLLAIVIAGAAASLALAVGLHASASDPFEQTFRATNGSDVHVLAWSERTDLTPLTGLPGVRAVSGPRRYVDVQATGKPANAPLSLQEMSVRPVLDRPHLEAGRWVGTTPGEVVLERTFARARHLAVGDELTVLERGHPTRLDVVGIAVSTERGPFPDFTPAGSWVSGRTLADLVAGGAHAHRALNIQLDDRDASGAFMQRARQLYPPDRVGLYDWKSVKEDATQATSGLTIVLGSASLFALLAAGFVIVNAISGRVLASRREIGLLKAAGFTPGGVTLLLVAENVILALGAGIVGTALGIALSPMLLHKSAELLGTPTPTGLTLQTVLAGVLGVAAVVALFTALPAWRAGRLKVLDAIRLGTTSVSARSSRLARLATRARLPVPVVLGVKDAFAARSRATMTILSLVLTVFAVVAALGTEATYRRVIGDSSLRAKPYDLLVEPSESRAAAAALVARHRGEFQNAVTMAEFPVTVPGRSTTLQARALGGDYQRRPYAVRDGRMLARPGEAIVGHGTLEKLGLHVGDRLRLNAIGAPLDLKIVGRYIEPDENGETAIFDERSLPAAQAGRLNPAYAITLAPTEAARRLGNELQAQSHGEVQATVTEDEVKQERADVRPIVWGIDVLLLSIGLVNLLTTLLLGVRERRRDFAIYKTVGLTPRGVLAAVTSSGSLMTIAAVVLGIPFGAFIFHLLVVATNPTDGPDLVTSPTWWWLVLVLPGMLLFTTVASLLPARRAAEVKPAEALRYE